MQGGFNVQSRGGRVPNKGLDQQSRPRREVSSKYISIRNPHKSGQCRNCEMLERRTMLHLYCSAWLDDPEPELPLML